MKLKGGGGCWVLGEYIWQDAIFCFEYTVSLFNTSDCSVGELLPAYFMRLKETYADLQRTRETSTWTITITHPGVVRL